MERFRVVSTLGTGGSGRVVLVEDRLRPGSRLALKELLDGGDDASATLHREFATLATLRHPSLVEVFELTIDEKTGRLQLAMEHIDGRDFVSAVRGEGARSLVPLLAETLRALAFLHDFGLVHRDLKPANVLVRHTAKSGHRIALLDFGLAAARDAAATEAAPQLAGTLTYLAPELIEGAPPTKRSDLYALGAMVFEAVHGKVPFALKGDDVGALLSAIREGRRARPKLPEGFAPNLGGWIDALLSPNPADRPTSAIDALARLNEACGAKEPTETSDDRAARLGSGAPVGRDDELAALRAELAPSPATRVIFVCGDAGSGKSRILRYLAAECVGAGWRVHVPPGVLPEAPDAFLARVRHDAAVGPTLVVLDEIERADQAIAGFLERLAREPREAPVRVLAAARPGELRDTRLKKLLGDVGVVPSLARIDLPALKEAGLKAMIERASAGHSSAQARVRWLLEASEGNAGAAEALLVEGIWERKAKIPIAGVLAQSIQRRLDALSDEARAWMEAAAVLGDDVAESLVGELAGLEERATDAAAEAVAAGLARRSVGRISPDSRRVAEATMAGTTPDRLRALHALAATHFAALESDLFGANAWRLARLWRGAGDTERAFSSALAAASAAEVAKDYASAAERYRFALTLLSRKDARRGELWMKLGDALRLATSHAPAARAYGWAARHAGDVASREMAKARRARALFSASRFEIAESAAASLVARDPETRLTASSALALVVLTHASLQRFEFQKAFETASRAARLTSDVPPDVRAESLIVQGAAGARLGDTGVDAQFAQAEEIARKHDLTDTLILLLSIRAFVEERANQFEKLESTLAETTKIATQAQRPDLLRRTLHQTARLHHMMSRFDRGFAAAKAAEELALFAALTPSAVISAILGAECLLDVGRTTEAHDTLVRYVDSPLPGTPEIWVRYPKMVLARTIVESPTPSSRDVAELLRGTLDACRATGPLVHIDGLVHTLIWRNSSGPHEALLAVLEEAAAASLRKDISIPEAARASLLLQMSLGYLKLHKYETAIGLLRDVASSGGTSVSPHLFGRIHFALADALSALARKDESAERRVSGQDLLQIASGRIENSDWRRDFLDQPVIRRLLDTVPKPAEIRRLETLYEMIRTLNSETDPEALLGAILEMAMNAVEAERGMILLSGPSGSDFSVRLSRNLEKETEADAEAFSKRIIAQAGLGEAVLALDAGHDDRFREFKSVNLFRIRSLMCVPLRSRGRITGTVYLDSRRQGKPFSREDLRFVEAFADHAALALENAKRRAELEAENRRLKAAVGERASYGKIAGRSPSMQKVFDLLERVADSDVTVLIQGESGTGKELVARALHFNGPRKDKPFVSENCAALPETLLESELFGHVKGAFTGADRDRTGLFEHAHGGTLFLDEVGDMSPAMQARLLRVLQEGELRRVGGDRPIHVDVRVIAATNKDLQVEIATGKFREDLYYRLAVIPVQMPPLRERVGDVPFLTLHLMERIAGARGRSAPRIESDVLDALERYPWPGNVRQLENVLRRISLLAGDAEITRAVIESDGDLSRMFLGETLTAGPILSMVKTEEEQIRRALDAAGGNRDRAARLLGISRATIYRKMREYSLR